MINDYMLDNLSVKIKEIIGIEKLDDTKILTEARLNYDLSQAEL